MANNVKSEIKNTGFADIPCDETIHRDDNHIFHLCKWNIKDQFIGYSDVIFTHKDTHRLLHPDYTNSLNPWQLYGTTTSATSSEETFVPFETDDLEKLKTEIKTLDEKYGHENIKVVKDVAYVIDVNIIDNKE